VCGRGVVSDSAPTIGLELGKITENPLLIAHTQIRVINRVIPMEYHQFNVPSSVTSNWSTENTQDKN